MKIIEALESENLRLSNGNRWLIVDDKGMFCVYERRHGWRYACVLITTESEDDAVAVLLRSEE